MEKSRDAFRTISEVADLLDTPAHVLRFWESRFPQIRPVKRAGGRRYYRPSDVALLSGIKRLLHGDGLTIRGVQKVLRENGIRHVMALAEGPIAQDALDLTPIEADEPPAAEVLAFPDSAAGRGAPQTESLPLWSAAPPLEGDHVMPPDPGGPIPVSGNTPPPPLPEATEYATHRGSAANPPHATGSLAPLDDASPSDLAHADTDADEPGLAGVIAARLRSVDATLVRNRQAELLAAALRLRDLRACLAVAAGGNGP